MSIRYMFFLAVVCVGIFICGCVQKTEKVADKRVTLTYGVWAETDAIPVHKQIIRSFEEKHPEIKVRAQYGFWGSYIEKLKIQLAGGSAPDLWMVDGQFVYEFAERKAVKDLTEWFQRDLEKEDYYCMDAVMDDKGRIWAVPYSFQSFALYYNKDLFDAIGLAYPTEEWTWDDMVRASKELTRDKDGDGRIDQFGLDGHALRLVAVLARGIRHVEEEEGKLVARYDSPELKEAIGEYVELRNRYNVIPSQAVLDTFATRAVELFAQGKLGMWLGLYYGVSVIEQNNPVLRYDVTLPPRAKVGRMRAGYYLPNCFGITASSSLECQEAAWKFIKFFSSYETQKLFGQKAEGFPFLKQAAHDLIKEHQGSPEHIEVFLEAIPCTPPFTPGYSLGRTAAYAESQGKARTYLERAVVGNIDVEQACREAQREAQKILDSVN